MNRLVDLLVRLGGPILAKYVGSKIGGAEGQLAIDAIGALAEAFGVAPTEEAVTDAVESEAGKNEEQAAAKVRYAEADMAKVLAAYAETMKQGNEQQRMTNELLQAQLKTPGWRSDWLYAWQWFLMAAWAWVIFVAPIGNAVLRVVAEPGLIGDTVAPPQLGTIDAGVLMTLTGIYLGLHMGGHTVLELIRNQWGGLFGKRNKDTTD